MERLVNLVRTLVAAGAVAAISTVSAIAGDITGAGATFPYPIYAKWADTYKKETGIGLNYQSIGSGGGIKQIEANTVTFGASDMPLKPDDLTKNGLVQFPTVMGGIVPVVNLDGISPNDLTIDGQTLAKIFLGEIKTWDDPAIKKLNPSAKLPSQAIAVAHRADGSGTTFIFTDYLSKVSADWKSKVGSNTSVEWPVGIGGKGNEGVAGLVKQTPGTVGYVELIYASQNKIPYGSVQNAAGEFLQASLASVTAAAASASKSMPADFRVSITNAPGKGAYPISSFTWLLFYEKPTDKARAKVMVDFTKWALTDGQKYCAELGYAPLPPEVVKLELEAIKRIAL